MALLSRKAWQSLRIGDLVDVVAPASSSSNQELKSGIRYLENLGLNVRVPKDIFKRQFALSNSDEYRFQHLLKSLLNTDSKAVWCVRGGYGSMRLLPALAKVRPPKTNKLFIGLSDITSLHIFFNQEWNWPTIHGPVLARMGSENPTAAERKEVEALIFGELTEISFRLKPLNTQARRKKTLRSSVVGGNLETIAAGQGTPWQLDTRRRIIFIEEINERGYRVDRKFQNFKQAGLFDNASAIVFGDFIGGAEPDSGKKMWKEAIAELAQSVRVPVFSGIRSGHGTLQRPVPFNTDSEIRNSTLVCATNCLLS
jgi:muramoyltetrapeptide carboxypeptidase